MRKLLLATTIALAGTSVASISTAPTIEASAAETLKSDSVKAFKKGTLKGATGKIGDKISSIKKKSKGTQAESGGMISGFIENKAKAYKAHPDEYMGYSKNSVQLIKRTYKYAISQKSVEKQLGKHYAVKNKIDNFAGSGYHKEYYYKAGKYRVAIQYYKKNTVVKISTAKWISGEKRS